MLRPRKGGSHFWHSFQYCAPSNKNRCHASLDNSLRAFPTGLRYSFTQIISCLMVYLFQWLSQPLRWGIHPIMCYNSNKKGHSHNYNRAFEVRFASFKYNPYILNIIIVFSKLRKRCVLEVIYC